MSSKTFANSFERIWSGRTVSGWVAAIFPALTDRRDRMDALRFDLRFRWFRTIGVVSGVRKESQVCILCANGLKIMCNSVIFTLA